MHDERRDPHRIGDDHEPWVQGARPMMVGLLALGLAAIGLIKLGGAVLDSVGQESAVGQVTGIEREYVGGRGSGHVYRARIRFFAKDGRMVDFLSPTGAARSWRVGQDIPVLYQPFDPADAIPASESRFLVPVVMLGISAITLSFLGLALKAARRREREKQQRPAAGPRVRAQY